MGGIWKKSSMVIVIMVLILSLIGCSSNSNNGTADEGSKNSNSESSTGGDAAGGSTEPVTLSIFGVVGSTVVNKPFQDDQVMAELEKRTGVKLDFTSELNVTDRAEKLAIMLAGNDLPDIVVYNSLTDSSKIQSANAAMPLDELVEKYGPNIKKNAGQAIELMKQASPDGKLYYLPGGIGNVQFSPLVNDNSWNIRWDLYKQLNYPKLETLDDLLNVLEQMQKLEPMNKDGKKNYGLGLNLSETWGQLMIDKAIANLQGFVQALPNDAYIDMNTGKLVPRISDPDNIFWKSMEFYNQAYRRGILDPESATLKYNTITEKYKTGRYFASTTHWSLGGADEQFITQGTPEKGFLPFMIDYNKQNIYVGQATYNGDQFQMFISKNCKNPEAAMKLIDYLYTNEGTELLTNGIEGVHYDMVNGVPIVKDEEIKAALADPNHFVQTGIHKYDHLRRYIPQNNPNGYPTEFRDVPETVAKVMTAAQKDFMEHYGYKTVTEAFTKVPTYVYDTSVLGSITTPAGSALQAKEQQLDAYLIANIAKVIFQKNDADYAKAKDKFLKDYEAKGAKEVFDYYVETYDKAMAQSKVQ
ncbi:extracellular solute-binding protein [Paenibacillus sepulcri]|uniref:Extracellular solute-binding protein n=1 Tax=Paenibacillus sepulcri TaxID=359917 RepID=A0ABS7C3C3_9BACL|nr:extracellular solute-binding protein [Paenibacillus sepulcri]